MHSNASTGNQVPYLLKGLVFGNDGRALSPFHTTKKNGRRYRYYVPQRENKEHALGPASTACGRTGICGVRPAAGGPADPDLLGEVLPRAMDLDPTLDEPKVTVAMTQLDAIWDQLFPTEQIRIVKLLVEKVIRSAVSDAGDGRARGPAAA